MVQNNKILTVSYGTFSCTLEGFDDAFGTMKAIAEYFRDLASDDRYFGAEPPVPDADMMALIAQREISRKVEARQDAGGGYVLRAADSKPEFAPPSKKTIHHSPRMVDKKTSEDAHLVPANPPLDHRGAPETRAFSGSQSSTVKPALDPDNFARQGTGTDKEAEAVMPLLLTGQTLAEVMARTESVMAPELIAEPVEVQEATIDSIVTRLERIRAVVSRTEIEHTTSDFAVQGDAVGFTNRGDPAEIATTLEETTSECDRNQGHSNNDQVLDSHVSMGAKSDSISDSLAPFLKQDDEIEADQTVLAGLRVDYPTEEIETKGPSKETPDGASSDSAPGSISTNLYAPVPETMALDGHKDSDDSVTDTSELNTVEDVSSSSNIASDGDDIVEQNASDLSQADHIQNFSKTDGNPDSDWIETRARAPEPTVMKVKRADLEAALAAGEFEEVSASSNAISPLTLEEEDDLDRELARIEVENTEVTEAFAESGSTDPKSIALDRSMESSAFEENSFVRADPAEELTADDDDLARLMTAIDERMETSESLTTHATYTQLRDAAAATENVLGVEQPNKSCESAEAYRADLEQIVRPRRPVASNRGPDSRACEPRPAPLKLAAGQRVDTALRTAKHGPVRPRRVAADPTEEATEETKNEDSFAEFADTVKATELPELLEAAAAYLIFVEGRAQFSRPQLMNRVRQIDTVSFDREAGLRSFGRLLKEGKIEKSGGGRFTASSDIGFRPVERAAG